MSEALAIRLPKEPRNGVQTPDLLATINAVKASPDLAKFRFRASNRWVSGTYSESRVESFSGAGGDHTHITQFRYAADHPTVLVGLDRGPTPIEFMLHGLAACITAGIGNIAAVRGMHADVGRVAGGKNIDLRGILGLSDEVRNGYQRIRISFDIAGDASAKSFAQSSSRELRAPLCSMSLPMVFRSTSASRLAEAFVLRPTRIRRRRTGGPRAATACPNCKGRKCHES